MTGKDVELVRFCAMLLQGDHPDESEALRDVAFRIEKELLTGEKP